MCNEWFATINIFPMCHLSLRPLQRSLLTKVGLNLLLFFYSVENDVRIYQAVDIYLIQNIKTGRSRRI